MTSVISDLVDVIFSVKGKGKEGYSFTAGVDIDSRILFILGARDPKLKRIWSVLVTCSLSYEVMSQHIIYILLYSWLITLSWGWDIQVVTPILVVHCHHRKVQRKGLLQTWWTIIPPALIHVDQQEGYENLCCFVQIQSNAKRLATMTFSSNVFVKPLHNVQ